MSKSEIAKRVSPKEYKTYRRRMLKAIRELNGCISIRYSKSKGRIKKDNGYVYVGKSF